MLGGIGSGERVFEIFANLVLERGGNLSCFARIIGGQRLLHGVGIVARHRRQQILLDPFQIGASEPRAILPKFARGGACSVSIGSSGWKK